ncbi:hypothetical protein OsJ_31481 [Oryza sativa Japonica Group]|nr:hypothetical protein OsJ_31481 [Oryza sativa Japonica Group]
MKINHSFGKVHIAVLPALDQGTDVGCPWPIRKALQEPRALGLSRSYEPPTHSVIGTQLLLRNEDAVMFLPALILNL